MLHTIQSLYKNIVLKLKVVYPGEEAHAIGDRLFEHFFNLTPVQRVISGAVIPSQKLVNEVTTAVDKLLNNMPLQYVVGKAWFMNMELEVTSGVLIPRPETEELVSLVLKSLSEHDTQNSIRILDIGTGSGCIAISLKHFASAAHVSAVDISQDALRVAEANAVKHNTAIELIHADILNESLWPRFPEYDLIISNPPYVTYSEKRHMLRNVLDYEPHSALFVTDEDPLLFYRAIIGFAKTRLCKGGSLWFEINEAFGEQVKQLALSEGFNEVNIFFDIRGKSRFLQCY